MKGEKGDFEIKRTEQTARVNGVVIDVDRAIADENSFVDRIITAEDFFDFRSHDRGWALDNNEIIGPKQLIDLAEKCEGNYALMMSREPTWSDHIVRIQNADLSRPIFITEDGAVIDGAHRMAKMFIEHIAHIPGKIVDHEKLRAYRVAEPNKHDVKNEKPEVRVATVADAPDIARIQHDSWLATYVNEEEKIRREDLLDYLKDIPSRADRWKDRILRKEAREIFVLREGDRVIGFCQVERRPKVGHVNALYLDPASAHRGFGGQLLQKGIDWLGNEHPLELEVASYNESAIRFYERNGFRKQGSIKPLVLKNGKLLPQTLMVRDVAEK